VTVVKATIARVLVLTAFAALGACNDPPPEVPAPQSQLVAPHAIDGGLDDEPADLALGPSDAFYDAYHGYMGPELKRDYLTTPESDRFERFGLRLLDFQLREDLLREHQHELTRDEKDVYRRLPTAEACRKYVADRATRRKGPPPPNDGGRTDNGRTDNGRTDNGRTDNGTAPQTGSRAQDDR
jgi:hypothetical protein